MLLRLNPTPPRGGDGDVKASIAPASSIVPRSPPTAIDLTREADSPSRSPAAAPAASYHIGYNLPLSLSPPADEDVPDVQAQLLSQDALDEKNYQERKERQARHRRGIRTLPESSPSPAPGPSTPVPTPSRTPEREVEAEAEAKGGGDSPEDKHVERVEALLFVDADGAAGQGAWETIGLPQVHRELKAVLQFANTLMRGHFKDQVPERANQTDPNRFVQIYGQSLRTQLQQTPNQRDHWIRQHSYAQQSAHLIILHAAVRKLLDSSRAAAKYLGLSSMLASGRLLLGRQAIEGIRELLEPVTNEAEENLDSVLDRAVLLWRRCFVLSFALGHRMRARESQYKARVKLGLASPAILSIRVTDALLDSFVGKWVAQELPDRTLELLRNTQSVRWSDVILLVDLLFPGIEVGTEGRLYPLVDALKTLSAQTRDHTVEIKHLNRSLMSADATSPPVDHLDTKTIVHQFPDDTPWTAPEAWNRLVRAVQELKRQQDELKRRSYFEAKDFADRATYPKARGLLEQWVAWHYDACYQVVHDYESLDDNKARSARTMARMLRQSVLQHVVDPFQAYLSSLSDAKRAALRDDPASPEMILGTVVQAQLSQLVFHMARGFQRVDLLTDDTYVQINRHIPLFLTLAIKTTAREPGFRLVQRVQTSAADWIGLLDLCSAYLLLLLANANAAGSDPFDETQDNHRAALICLGLVWRRLADLDNQVTADHPHLAFWGHAVPVPPIAEQIQLHVSALYFLGLVWWMHMERTHTPFGIELAALAVAPATPVPEAEIEAKVPALSPAPAPAPAPVFAPILSILQRNVVPFAGQFAGDPDEQKPLEPAVVVVGAEDLYASSQESQAVSFVVADAPQGTQSTPLQGSPSSIHTQRSPRPSDASVSSSSSSSSETSVEDTPPRQLLGEFQQSAEVKGPAVAAAAAATASASASVTLVHIDTVPVDRQTQLFQTRVADIKTNHPHLRISISDTLKNYFKYTKAQKQFPGHPMTASPYSVGLWWLPGAGQTLKSGAAITALYGEQLSHRTEFKPEWMTSEGLATFMPVLRSFEEADDEGPVHGWRWLDCSLSHASIRVDATPPNGSVSALSLQELDMLYMTPPLLRTSGNRHTFTPHLPTLMASGRSAASAAELTPIIDVIQHSGLGSFAMHANPGDPRCNAKLVCCRVTKGRERPLLSMEVGQKEVPILDLNAALRGTQDWMFMLVATKDIPPGTEICCDWFVTGVMAKERLDWYQVTDVLGRLTPAERKAQDAEIKEHQTPRVAYSASRLGAREKRPRAAALAAQQRIAQTALDDALPFRELRERVYLSVSNIPGAGLELFARVPIAAGTNLVRYDGLRTTVKYMQRNMPIRDRVKMAVEVYNNKEFCTDAVTPWFPVGWFNHAFEDQANVGPADADDKEVTLFATRKNVEAKTPLRWNYGVAYWIAQEYGEDTFGTWFVAMDQTRNDLARLIGLGQPKVYGKQILLLEAKREELRRQYNVWESRVREKYSGSSSSSSSALESKGDVKSRGPARPVVLSSPVAGRTRSRTTRDPSSEGTSGRFRVLSVLPPSLGYPINGRGVAFYEAKTIELPIGWESHLPHVRPYGDQKLTTMFATERIPAMTYLGPRTHVSPHPLYIPLGYSTTGYDLVVPGPDINTTYLTQTAQSPFASDYIRPQQLLPTLEDYNCMCLLSLLTTGDEKDADRLDTVPVSPPLHPHLIVFAVRDIEPGEELVVYRGQPYMDYLMQRLQEWYPRIIVPERFRYWPLRPTPRRPRATEEEISGILSAAENMRTNISRREFSRVYDDAMQDIATERTNMSLTERRGPWSEQGFILNHHWVRWTEPKRKVMGLDAPIMLTPESGWNRGSISVSSSSSSSSSVESKGDSKSGVSVMRGIEDWPADSPTPGPAARSQIAAWLQHLCLEQRDAFCVRPFSIRAYADRKTAIGVKRITARCMLWLEHVLLWPPWYRRGSASEILLAPSPDRPYTLPGEMSMSVPRGLGGPVLDRCFRVCYVQPIMFENPMSRGQQQLFLSEDLLLNSLPPESDMKWAYGPPFVIATGVLVSDPTGASYVNWSPASEQGHRSIESVALQADGLNSLPIGQWFQDEDENDPIRRSSPLEEKQILSLQDRTTRRPSRNALVCPRGFSLSTLQLHHIYELPLSERVRSRFGPVAYFVSRDLALQELAVTPENDPFTANVDLGNVTNRLSSLVGQAYIRHVQAVIAENVPKAPETKELEKQSAFMKIFDEPPSSIQAPEPKRRRITASQQLQHMLERSAGDTKEREVKQRPSTESKTSQESSSWWWKPTLSAENRRRLLHLGEFNLHNIPDGFLVDYTEFRQVSELILPLQPSLYSHISYLKWPRSKRTAETLQEIRLYDAQRDDRLFSNDRDWFRSQIEKDSKVHFAIGDLGVTTVEVALQTLNSAITGPEHVRWALEALKKQYRLRADEAPILPIRRVGFAGVPAVALGGAPDYFYP